MDSSNLRPFAVVTGASSGIGYELAREFAGHGYDLAVVAEDGGIVEAQQAFQSLGAEVHAFRIDLSTYDGVQSCYEQIRALGKPIAALALNAGIGTSGSFVKDTDLEKEISVINLNVQSTVHLSKLFLRDMVTRDEGRILYTSSLAGMSPGPYYAVYAASKAFIESFAQAIRFELKDLGSHVSITTLLPNATDTNFFARAEMEDTKAGRGEKDSPRDVARDGFEALMNGDDHVFPASMKNSLQGFMSKFMPDTVGAKQQAEMARPRSGLEEGAHS